MLFRLCPGTGKKRLDSHDNTCAWYSHLSQSVIPVLVNALTGQSGKWLRAVPGWQRYPGPGCFTRFHTRHRVPGSFARRPEPVLDGGA